MWKYFFALAHAYKGEFKVCKHARACACQDFFTSTTTDSEANLLQKNRLLIIRDSITTFLGCSTRSPPSIPVVCLLVLLERKRGGALHKDISVCSGSCSPDIDISVVRMGVIEKPRSLNTSPAPVCYGSQPGTKRALVQGQSSQMCSPGGQASLSRAAAHPLLPKRDVPVSHRSKFCSSSRLRWSFPLLYPDHSVVRAAGGPFGRARTATSSERTAILSGQTSITITNSSKQRGCWSKNP